MVKQCNCSAEEKKEVCPGCGQPTDACTCKEGEKEGE